MFSFISFIGQVLLVAMVIFGSEYPALLHGKADDEQHDHHQSVKHSPQEYLFVSDLQQLEYTVIS